MPCVIWRKLTQITHLFIVTVTTRSVVPPTKTASANELKSCLGGVICISQTPASLFIELSQRPCANGAEGGLCCVGWCLHKICACGNTHTTPTGNPWQQLEPWLYLFSIQTHWFLWGKHKSRLSDGYPGISPTPPLIPQHFGLRMQRAAAAATMRRLCF